MDKQSFQEMAQESDQAFRQQFDPTSASFHGGPQTPVPLNGDRIPESMQSMYPEGYDPNKPVEVIDYGEEYRQVQSARNGYLNLKKSLAKLGPVVEGFMRHDQIFKDKGDPNNEAHKKVHQDSIQKQTENLNAVNAELAAYVPQFQQNGQEGKAFAKQLNQIIEESKKKYNDKESLANFNFKVKKLSTQTFAAAQKNLQKLKDIKKEHAAKQNVKKQQAPTQ